MQADRSETHEDDSCRESIFKLVQRRRVETESRPVCLSLNPISADKMWQQQPLTYSVCDILFIVGQQLSAEVN